MRLFIALLPDEPFLEAIRKLQEEMRKKGIHGHYTPEENLHFTLAFIGEYPDPEKVSQVMESIPAEPFVLRTDRLGKYQDLYWCGIEPCPELTEYVRRLRHALADAGIPYDRKKFEAHMTLVRKAYTKNREDYPEIEIPEKEMTAVKVSLMRSDRGKHEMIYTEVGGYYL